MPVRWFQRDGEDRFDALAAADTGSEGKRKTLSLHDLDLMHPAVRVQDEMYRLFVGAFLTEQGAEEQHRILESKGVYSQVIER